MPEQVLSSLLSKVDIPSNGVGLVNLSPYDGWLESTAYQWLKQAGSVRMPWLSLCKSLTITEYCQRSIALKLLEDKGSNKRTHWMN